MSIYKVDKGYRAEVSLGTNPLTNKPIRKTKTFRLKGDARAWEIETLDKYNKGTLDVNGNMKLEEYMEYWYKTCIKDIKKYQTQTRYRTLTTCIIDHMGHMRIDKIKAPHIDKFYKDLQEEMTTLKSGITQRRYSDGTILKVHRVFRQALEKAVGWDMIVKNPVNYAAPPKEEKKEIEIWNLSQVNTFLDKIKDEQIYLPTFIAFHSGLRVGEICALRWQDIDFNKGILMVNHNAVEKTGEGIVLEEPKTESSKAPVALTNQLTLKLKEVKRDQQIHKLANGFKNDFEFVCSWPDNRPVRPTYVTKRFKDMVELHDMPKLTPHGLRHTHGSILFELGESSHAISKRLRHSRVSTTDDIYIHITEEIKKSTAQSFERAVDQIK